MEKTNDPGIYKRKTKQGDTRYVVVYYVGGRQKRETARTLKDARRLKAARATDRDRGELFEGSNAPFREYAAEWIERYQGNGRRGFTEATRDEYRRDLKRYAYPQLCDKPVSAITPRDVANWIGWLCDQRRMRTKKNPGGRALSDSSIRRILAPVRSCLATAKREGLIRSNPIDGAALPHRPQIKEGEAKDVRALTREQLDAFLRVVRGEWWLMFRFLAATGLRWSELIELRWRDFSLDAVPPHVQVRRANVKGTVKPPKTKHGVRDVPLEASIARKLRERRTGAQAGPDELVFPTQNSSALDHSNMLRRVLRPAAEEAGAPWAGFHTFRHTCASMLFSAGRNPKQVQHWLGHHSPTFTLDRYGHLMDEGVGTALDVTAELDSAARDNVMTIRPTQTDPTAPETVLAKVAD
jgi:integrase